MTGTNRSQEGGRANHHPLKHGVEPGDVKTFEDFLGASATNVAVTAGRYGWSVAAAVNWSSARRPMPTAGGDAR